MNVKTHPNGKRQIGKEADRHDRMRLQTTGVEVTMSERQDKEAAHMTGPDVAERTTIWQVRTLGKSSLKTSLSPYAPIISHSNPSVLSHFLS